MLYIVLLPVRQILVLVYQLCSETPQVYLILPLVPVRLHKMRQQVIMLVLVKEHFMRILVHEIQLLATVVWYIILKVYITLLWGFHLFSITIMQAAIQRLVITPWLIITEAIRIQRWAIVLFTHA